jgi:hypothetical protein
LYQITISAKAPRDYAAITPTFHISDWVFIFPFPHQQELTATKQARPLLLSKSQYIFSHKLKYGNATSHCVSETKLQTIFQLKKQQKVKIRYKIVTIYRMSRN